MSNAVWPTHLQPSTLGWRLQKTGVQFRSPFTGSLQAVDFNGDYWEVTMGIRGEGRLRQRSGELEALLMYLSGGLNQIDIYNWVRPFPRGTMRGTPTLQMDTTRGAMQIVLNVAAGATLMAGDFIGLAGQLLMVRSNCAAVSTTLTVPLVTRVRTVVTQNAAVEWNRPLVSVVMADMNAGLQYQPGQTLPVEIKLVEP